MKLCTSSPDRTPTQGRLCPASWVTSGYWSPPHVSCSFYRLTSIPFLRPKASRSSWTLLFLLRLTLRAPGSAMGPSFKQADSSYHHPDSSNSHLTPGSSHSIPSLPASRGSSGKPKSGLYSKLVCLKAKSSNSLCVTTWSEVPTPTSSSIYHYSATPGCWLFLLLPQDLCIRSLFCLDSHYFLQVSA